MNGLGWLTSARKSAWRFLSGGKVVSAISHLVLVVAGSAPFAYLAFVLSNDRAFTVLVYFVCASFWSHFMLAREVLDYCKKKAKARVVEDIEYTWQDGLGDLAGPFLNLFGAWTVLCWIVLGGA